MKITDTIKYVGVNDHRIDLFEGQYKVPGGMSYNSYVILDEKIAVMDTVDADFTHQWLDNIQQVLDGRKPDYLIVQHMEPDHAANVANFLKVYPDTTVVATGKAFGMIRNFFELDLEGKKIEAENGSTLSLGYHQLTFVFAPMVHWPEVMVTYDSTEKVLFSADGFGKFGALDAEEEWAEEAARYYLNIVGKYGVQVQGLLKKASGLDIRMICPLHGYIIRKDFEKYLAAYTAWGTYTAEEQGVLVLYASPYGNTKNGAEILANELAAKGVDKMKLIDVSHMDPMYILPEVFRFSNLVIATTTYNGDMFIKMEEALTELRSMGVSNKKVSIIQSGSWAPTAGKKVQEMTDQLTGTEYVGDMVTIKGTVKEDSREALVALADAIAESLK